MKKKIKFIIKVLIYIIGIVYALELTNGGYAFLNDLPLLIQIIPLLIGLVVVFFLETSE